MEGRERPGELTFLPVDCPEAFDELRSGFVLGWGGEGQNVRQKSGEQCYVWSGVGGRR